MKLNTVDLHKKVLIECKKVFESKTKDYGTSWRIMRLPSLTDQIMIKAQRIRSIQEKKNHLIEDDSKTEFIGIINYCIISLIQIDFKQNQQIEIESEKINKAYSQIMKKITELFKNKNHDYEEAWENMRITSMTDIILMKLLRIKQIEDNHGKTLISEGVETNYVDIANYAIFCLIKLNRIKKE